MPNKRTIPRTCQQCGRDFLANAYEVKVGGGKFCSHACYALSIRKASDISRTCRWCGSAFLAKAWFVAKGHGLYCSNTCNGLASRATTGYLRFGDKRFAHRVVWEAAHGPIPPGYSIHHRDGNSRNNDLGNLQMLTRGEHGRLHNQGEGCGSAKLTEAQVRALRADHALGGVTGSELARRYGINPVTAWNILHRKTWRHVT